MFVSRDRLKELKSNNFGFSPEIPYFFGKRSSFPVLNCFRSTNMTQSKIPSENNLGRYKLFADVFKILTHSTLSLSSNIILAILMIIINYNVFTNTKFKLKIIVIEKNINSYDSSFFLGRL